MTTFIVQDRATIFFIAEILTGLIDNVKEQCGELLDVYYVSK